MRRIGFSLRFSALVIDVSVIILLVFGLYFGLGKHLYTSIGVMQKKSGIDPNAQIGAVVRGYTVAAEPAAPARTTGSTQQSAPSAGEIKLRRRLPGNKEPAMRFPLKNRLPQSSPSSSQPRLRWL